MGKKHSHYYKDVCGLSEIDVYLTCKLFEIKDDSGALQHAIKKLLLAGGRGAGKDKLKDIEEARDSLNRYLEIENPKDQNQIAGKHYLVVDGNGAALTMDDVLRQVRDNCKYVVIHPNLKKDLIRSGMLCH